MTTQVLSAQDAEHWASAAEAAVGLLRRGELVALPTETVYGLACDALNPAAAAAVFAAKERPSFDPLIVHVPDHTWIGKLSEVNKVTAELVQRLTEKFWPGPLTLVLPSKPVVPDLVRSGLPTVALRCSAHPVMAAVLHKLGGPVAAPSANRFGRISPVTAAHVVEELGGRIPLVLDGGPCRHGLESTIVAVEDGRLILLRPGPVTTEELEKFAPVERIERGEKLSAPGMLDSHYAPRTPLKILASGDVPPADAAECGVLSFGTEEHGFAVVEKLSPHPELAAPEFFAALRRLDASGVRCIYARALPDSGLGMAIMDRLRRASHD
jgi:L-threonylcarbamoyladenylate synthase